MNNPAAATFPAKDSSTVWNPERAFFDIGNPWHWSPTVVDRDVHISQQKTCIDPYFLSEEATDFFLVMLAQV
ncbi:hypothetical protein ACTL6P_24400 [Endozoicomonas acroporae]|uniref:hypothetical protein n=1 Tax=Endozoicomonas acroporae TaxID=1701104 RepID=UPI003F8B9B4B